MGQARRKLWRVGKWAGLVVVVLVVAVDVLSIWVCVEWGDRRWSGAVGQGQLQVCYFGGNLVPVRHDWSVIQGHVGHEWGIDWFKNSVATRVGTPLWLIGILIVLPTALLWWSDRRDKGPGHCPNCGYDLRGLATGAKCPECGKAGN